MKIVILKNKIQDNAAVDKGIELVKQSFASISFPVEITIKEINTTFTGQNFNNSAIGAGVQIVPEQILAQVSGVEDVAFLIFNNNDVIPKPLNPTQAPIKKGNTTPCQMCEQWYNGFPEVFRDFFLHEISHALFFLNNQVANDTTHAYPPEFGQKPRADYYLSLINKFKTMPATQTYKYFKPSEIVGLKPEFVALLDKARGIAGVPFKITSGFRTPAQNASVGGVQDSAHETGLACDLAVSDSVTGGKILLALAQVGFKRFGFYGDNHIHVDMDSTKPTPCYWIK